MCEGAILLTGATGLLGQYLLGDLLQQDVPLAVLIRACGGQPARARLNGLVARWEQVLARRLPRPRCLKATSPRQDSVWMRRRAAGPPATAGRCFITGLV
jgi:hypothetical protein